MPTYIDWAREVCLALPHATEDVKWEHNLLFRIAGKMFCVANLEPAMSRTKIAFKCTPERFAELVEIEGIIPAPYMAHNKWVAVQELGALRQAELRELIHASYQLVLQKLPKKTQASLAAKPVARKTKAKQPPAAKRKK
jgi:predicted DNA-binding protein (MmcQ/YjbR family)